MKVVLVSVFVLCSLVFGKEIKFCAQDVARCANGAFVLRDPFNGCEFMSCLDGSQPKLFDMNTPFNPAAQPIPMPMPIPMPVPQPIPMPVPQPIPMPMPMPVPQPIPIPMPVPVPVPEPMPMPHHPVDPDTSMGPDHHHGHHKGHKGHFKPGMPVPSTDSSEHPTPAELEFLSALNLLVTYVDQFMVPPFSQYIAEVDLTTLGEVMDESQFLFVPSLDETPNDPCLLVYVDMAIPSDLIQKLPTEFNERRVFYIGFSVEPCPTFIGKVCSDGTVVTMQGPTCEWAACPVPTDSQSDQASYDSDSTPIVDPVSDGGYYYESTSSEDDSASCNLLFFIAFACGLMTATCAYCCCARRPTKARKPTCGYMPVEREEPAQPQATTPAPPSPITLPEFHMPFPVQYYPVPVPPQEFVPEPASTVRVAPAPSAIPYMTQPLVAIPAYEQALLWAQIQEQRNQMQL